MCCHVHWARGFAVNVLGYFRDALRRGLTGQTSVWRVSADALTLVSACQRQVLTTHESRPDKLPHQTLRPIKSLDSSNFVVRDDFNESLSCAKRLHDPNNGLTSSPASGRSNGNRTAVMCRSRTWMSTSSVHSSMSLTLSISGRTVLCSSSMITDTRKVCGNLAPHG